MGANTKIEWAHHTFNPWIGCTKVSEGCKNCYAENMMDSRLKVAKWGDNGTRIRTSPVNWNEPVKWDLAAQLHSRRARVFCASLADVFEDRPELHAWRKDLFELILATPYLDWLLLTKRPENVMPSIDAAFELAQESEIMSSEAKKSLFAWSLGALPPNLWIGTSVENQEAADKRIPELLKIPAKVRFLSMEPLLGPVDIRSALIDIDDHGMLDYPIDWVIVGGESGRNARPMHPDWARSLRNQCQAAGVPFLFKQWGEWAPENNTPKRAEFHSWGMFRVGKHDAGRILDGSTHDEFPEVQL